MKNVLIVDDIPSNRKIANVILKKNGWYTEEVDSGMAALNRDDLAKFSHILLDINMPDLDGMETCRRLRAQSALQHLRIVAYTAHALEHEQCEIMSNGFDAIVTKPISVQSLLGALQGD